MTRQLAIFSAESARESIADLAGLLYGPGELAKMGGTSRVSILVDAAWRVHALAAEFAARGVGTRWDEALGGCFWARTAYTSALVGLHRPSYLDGARLRLWFTASGRLEEEAIQLDVGRDSQAAIEALAILGLNAHVAGQVIRIEGTHQVNRFAELIGPRPAAASQWPVAPELMLTAPALPVQRRHRVSDATPLPI